MATYKVFQGDSLWIDIQGDSVDVIDSTTNSWPTNWAGVWDIESTITSGDNTTPRISGILTPDATTHGLFYLRINYDTAGWATLPVGTYFLTIQITNSTTKYRREAQHKVVVQAQGVT